MYYLIGKVSFITNEFKDLVKVSEWWIARWAVIFVGGDSVHVILIHIRDEVLMMAV